MVRPPFTVPARGWPQLGYWVRKGDVPCFVYVIQAEGDSPIKVGKATVVPARIAELQTGNPRPLDLLHVLVGGLDLEKALHKLLAPRDRMTGEWFDGPSVSGFLERIDGLASQMVLHHRSTRELPDYRQFSPFKHQTSQYGWTGWEQGEQAA